MIDFLVVNDRYRNRLFSTFLPLTDYKNSSVNSNYIAIIATNDTKTQYYITTYNFPKNYVHTPYPGARAQGGEAFYFVL